MTVIVQICTNCQTAANQGHVKHPVTKLWKCATADQVLIEVEIPNE